MIASPYIVRSVGAYCGEGSGEGRRGYPSEECGLAVSKSCLHSAMALRAWSRLKNWLSFKSSSRIRPLTLST